MCKLTVYNFAGGAWRLLDRARQDSRDGDTGQRWRAVNMTLLANSG